MILSWVAILLLFAVPYKPFGRLQNLDWSLGHQLASFEGKFHGTPTQHPMLRHKKGGPGGLMVKNGHDLDIRRPPSWSFPATIHATPSVRPTRSFNLTTYSPTLRSVEPPSSSGFSGVTSIIFDLDSPSVSSALPSSTILTEDGPEE